MIVVTTEAFDATLLCQLNVLTNFPNISKDEANPHIQGDARFNMVQPTTSTSIFVR